MAATGTNGAGVHQTRRWAGKSVLLYENGLLKPRRERSIRGIELFRFNLIREMMRRGIDVTVLCEGSWKRRIRDFLGDDAPRLVSVPNLGGAAINGVLAAIRGRGIRADLLFVGNPGRGMLGGARILAGAAADVLFMAHRPAKESLLRRMRSMRGRVVAVSEYIAGPYREMHQWDVGVMYGVAGAAAFAPRSSPKSDADPIDFIVLGKIDSPLKGSDDAIAAFESLPTNVRSRCRLHLASYVRKPPHLPDGVVAHGWIPANDVPTLLRDMDVMLSPSKAESFSQATVQGMLCGLPIIASDLPVLVEKLDTGGGIVATSVNEIREAMVRLATDKQERARMGAIARDTALARYVWDTDRFLSQWVFQ